MPDETSDDGGTPVLSLVAFRGWSTIILHASRGALVLLCLAGGAAPATSIPIAAGPIPALAAEDCA